MNTDLLKDILDWDVLSWSEALMFWDDFLPAELDGFSGLELGARDGGLSLYLALKGCEMTCSDLNYPSQKAIELHQNYQMESLMAYENINALDIPYEENYFDVVIFKSILGGIGRDGHSEKQEQAIQEAYRVLKPGGYLLFAENLKGTFIHMRARKLLIKWASYWNYLGIERMKEYLKPFNYYIYQTFGFSGIFSRGHLKSPAYALDKMLDPILKENQKYIVFGIAVK